MLNADYTNNLANVGCPQSCFMKYNLGFCLMFEFLMKTKHKLYIKFFLECVFFKHFKNPSNEKKKESEINHFKLHENSDFVGRFCLETHTEKRLKMFTCSMGEIHSI